MPTDQYTDLEIRIQAKTEHGYPVEMTLGGSQEFRGGYLPAEIIPWIPSASPEDDGRRLFEALFADEGLRRDWEGVRRQANQRRIRLRIDTAAPELHTIPWEVLHDTNVEGEPQPIAANTATPFSRYLAGKWQPGQPIQAYPINIAVAVASPDNLDEYNLAPIDIETEQAIIKEATETLDVTLHFIPQPCTLSAIEAAIKDGCHIMHFVGHGAFSERRDQSILYLADEDNQVSITNGDDFSAMISRQLADQSQVSPLRMIVFASCETAKQSQDDAFRGLAPQLIGAGVPTILAMQGQIAQKTAQTFTQTFYKEVLQHGQVDVASNGARATLLTEKRPGSELPVLYSRLKDNQLLVPRLLANLVEAEAAYRQRVRDTYAAEADYYIELSAETNERRPDAAPTQAPRANRRRRVRPEYQQWIQAGQEIKRITLSTLREGVDKYPCLILLGDPGSGKTTALEHLAYQFAGEAEKLPIPLRLSAFRPDMHLDDFIAEALGSVNGWQSPELVTHLAHYLEAGRLFFLFDALNEMPRQDFKARAQALRAFIDTWSAKGNHFLVTCRVLDYGEELTGLQRVEIQPLNDAQIQDFLQSELPNDWEALWQRLNQPTTLNPVSSMPHRALLDLARNPYILTMMIDIYLEDETLGQNQAALMTRFSQILLSKEKPNTPLEQWLDPAVQAASLATLAFEMQHRAGSGSAVETGLATLVMPENVQTDPNWPARPAPPEQVLTLAASANIIEMPVDRSSVRFYHQLLQEYFAAQALLKEMGQAANLNQPSLLNNIEGGLQTLWGGPRLESEMPLWERPVGNNDPLPPPPATGWEETTILAAGLAAENDQHLVQALIEINPVLAGRCLHEGQAKVDATLRQRVIAALLETIARPEVALRVRIAAGEVLGYLGDPRLGAMVFIPAGSFKMGDGEEQHQLELPAYQIGQYLVTNAEYASFLAAGGYQDNRWWTDAGWAEKEKPRYEDQPWTEPRYWQDGRFNKPNQPVVGVSWYEAVAYCRWLSAETVQIYRLATEAEWEKGSRGKDGRQYPWGDKFEASRLNAYEGEQQVRATTPVGIYANGISPNQLYDCAGNVLEWCQSRHAKYPYQVDDSREDLDGTDVRVLRGGSWNDDLSIARCAARYWNDSFYGYDDVGFRLVSPSR